MRLQTNYLQLHVGTLEELQQKTQFLIGYYSFFCTHIVLLLTFVHANNLFIDI